jgi:hypothetical protein
MVMVDDFEDWLSSGLCTLMLMEAMSSSETSVTIYQTTRCYIPEDGRLQTRRRENLKSYR